MWSDTLPLPPGEVGEFVVRGPMVTRRYFNRPEATKLAKIRDPRTGEVLHRMGDVGYLDDRGRLWFCGRKSHRVVTPHGTLFTDMVEPIFNTVPGVARTALVGLRTVGGGTEPVLCVELDAEGLRDYWTRILYSARHAASTSGSIEGRLGYWSRIVYALREVGQRFEHTRQIQRFQRHPGFPVDVRHNSKIFREKLAAWVAARYHYEFVPASAVESPR